jgi:hypothetical protein
MSKTTIANETPREEQERCFTKQEFCDRNGMSLSTFYKIQRNGFGPKMVRIPGMRFAVVTRKAEREWLAEREEYSETEAAKIEAQRRSAAAKVAAEIAAKSPRHYSKTKKRK